MPAPIATPIAMSSSAPFDPQRRSHRELPIALAARALTTDIDMLPVAVESKTSFVPLHIDTGWNCTNCHCVNESTATTCLECNLLRHRITDVTITDTDDDVAISVEDVPTTVTGGNDQYLYSTAENRMDNDQFFLNVFCSPCGFVLFIGYPIMLVHSIATQTTEGRGDICILSVLFVLWMYYVLMVGNGRYICKKSTPCLSSVTYLQFCLIFLFFLIMYFAVWKKCIELQNGESKCRAC